MSENLASENLASDNLLSQNLASQNLASQNSALYQVASESLNLQTSPDTFNSQTSQSSQVSSVCQTSLLSQVTSQFVTVQLVPDQSIGANSQRWDAEFGDVYIPLQQVFALIDSHDTLETYYLPAVVQSSKV